MSWVAVPKDKLKGEGISPKFRQMFYRRGQDFEGMDTAIWLTWWGVEIMYIHSNRKNSLSWWPVSSYNRGMPVVCKLLAMDYIFICWVSPNFEQLGPRSCILKASCTRIHSVCDSSFPEGGFMNPSGKWKLGFFQCSDPPVGVTKPASTRANPECSGCRVATLHVCKQNCSLSVSPNNIHQHNY